MFDDELSTSECIWLIIAICSIIPVIFIVLILFVCLMGGL